MNEIAKTSTPLNRFVSLFAGFSFYSLFSWLYDYPFCTFVIWKFGYLKGTVIFTLLSIVVDIISIKLYDWSETDWLAIEYLKSVKSYSGENKLKKLIKYIFTSTPVWVQVVVLSPKFNAFIITALLREGSYQFNGLSKRDWCIFWGSFLTTQLYWLIIISLGVYSAETLM